MNDSSGSDGAVVPCLLNAGAGNARAVRRSIEGDDRFILRTCQPDDLMDVLESLLREDVPRLAVAGGDGTVAAAAGRLFRSGTELAVIPAGTLDHFARSLDIPLSTDDALNLAAEGRGRRIDVGFAGDRLFLSTSSVGAYVDFVHERERWRKWIGYYAASTEAAVRILLHPPAQTVRVESDDAQKEYRTPLVFLRLREREGPDPTRDSAEGGFRLAVVKGRKRVRLVALAAVAAFRGIDRASQTPHLLSFFVDGCSIGVAGKRTYVALDGETIRMETPIDFRIERNALDVVAP